MKNFQLSFSVFILLLSLLLTFASWGSSSSIFEVTPTSEDFIRCLQSNSNNGTTISQLIFTPANSSFQTIWQERINNRKFIQPTTPRPSIIATPTDETQIQTILLCAKKLGYVLRVRSGGHDFEGISSIAPSPLSVMVDLINMRSIDVNVTSRTAWVQTGALLGELYYAISQKSNTLYFPAGICPTVGIGGYLSGGGYGNLLRKYGTGADQALDIRFMDVNGNILDRKSMGTDLWWALRGGGGGSFGIILAWKVALVPVPEIVTVFNKGVTLEQNGTDIFYKYQFVAPRMDRNLMIRVPMFSEYIGNTTTKTVRINFEGLYLGRMDALLSMMEKRFPELNVTQEVCEEMRMVQSSLVLGEPPFPSSTPTALLANRTGIPRRWTNKQKSDYVRTPIPKSGLRKIWRKMFENDMSELLMMYTFGGRMNDFSDTATPYPHRAGVLYQVLKDVNFEDQTSDKTPVSLKRLEWLRSLDKLLEPYVSKNPREAYLNYNDLEMGFGSATYAEASVWGERYFKRANFKRLIQIKARVDPDNFFQFPQSIPVFSSLSDDM